MSQPNLPIIRITLYSWMECTNEALYLKHMWPITQHISQYTNKMFIKKCRIKKVHYKKFLIKNHNEKSIIKKVLGKKCYKKYYKKQCLKKITDPKKCWRIQSIRYTGVSLWQSFSLYELLLYTFLFTLVY